MENRLGLFVATLQYNLLRFLPGRKEQLWQELEELSEGAPTELNGFSILQTWLESFDLGGLLLGCVALFLPGLILMLAADLLAGRSGRWAGLIRFLSAVYCEDKFRGPSAVVNKLLVLYLLNALLCGFSWSLTMVFLIAFTILFVYTSKGGRLC